MLMFSQPENWIFPHCFFSILHFQTPYNRKETDTLKVWLKAKKKIELASLWDSNSMGNICLLP